MNIHAQLAFIDARLTEHAIIPGTDDEVATRIIFTETMDALTSNILDYEAGIDESYCYHTKFEMVEGQCSRANKGIDSLNLITGLWSGHQEYKEVF
jgi:hypothetical protein